MADITEWSTTAADNDAAPPDGWPEGQAASTVNDCAREMMAAVRRQMEGAEWFDWGHAPTRVDDDTFTVATDLTAVYHAGRRVKATGSATGYATIASSSYSAPNTTVNVTMDSGNLPGTLSAVYVGIISATSDSVPEIPDARLSSNVPLKDAANTFTEAQTFPAESISDAALSSNVPLKDAANTFTLGQTITLAGAGTCLAINVQNGSSAIVSSDGTVTGFFAPSTGAAALQIGTSTNHAVVLYSNNVTRASLGTGLILGSPAGGDKGAGTLNTAGAIYQNNVAVALSTSFDSGTFTATLTGCTTAPTGTATWYRAGNIVTLVLPALSATSNANTCTYTGLPAGIQPATLSAQNCKVQPFVDGSSPVSDASAQISAGSGTITFLRGISSSGFTSGNTKGINNDTAITYLLT